MIAMIASAIADSSSRWRRSATRCFAPTYLTVARPEAVLRTREIAGGTSPVGTCTCSFGGAVWGGGLRANVNWPPGFSVACETSA